MINFDAVDFSERHSKEVKSLAAGVQGPLKGPWKLRGSSCSLVESEPYFGSILSNKFIIV